MVNETTLGEALGEMQEALYLLRQLPAGSFIGPPWSENQQPVEEAIAECEQHILEQQTLIKIHGANYILPHRDDEEHDSIRNGGIDD